MDQHTHSESLELAALKKRVAQLEARESQLRQDYKQLEQLFDCAPLCFQSLDENGRILLVNQTWEKTLGYSRDELMGMNDRQYTDARSAKELFQAFNEVYRTGKPLWLMKGGTRCLWGSQVSC